MKHSRKRTMNFNLRNCLLVSFVVLAFIPLLASVLLSSHNDKKDILENRDRLVQLDLKQITQELDAELQSYEDILYQLCADDSFSELATMLDSSKDQTLARKQIHRHLQGAFWLKDYVASVTVITHEGDNVFYDCLSSSSQQNVSLNAMKDSPVELYRKISENRGYTYFPTQHVTRFNGVDYDLFFIGHQILTEHIGHTDAVILMGIDVRALQEFMTKNWIDHPKYMFATDQNGWIIWHPDAELIGSQIAQAGGDVVSFAATHDCLGSKNQLLLERRSKLSGWNIYSAVDKDSFTRALNQRLLMSVLVALISFGMVILLVLFLTKWMTKSVRSICDTMNRAADGDLSARVALPDRGITEIQAISQGFNTMEDRLEELIKEKEESTEKIKNAEITALEAQLNPHFLYNTLDMLNWMAIEKEEYPISNIISSLGKILRYGIDRSNSIVTISEEEAWMKQYLFLHQNRLKSAFHCVIDVPQEVQSCRVHKLFLQPFIENTMIHGFSPEQKDCRLEIHIHLEGDKLTVQLTDNGRGIPEQVLQTVHTSQSYIERGKRYHGMQNAINRLLLYYGDQAEISVKSRVNEGTCIEIRIPSDSGEDKSCES